MILPISKLLSLSAIALFANYSFAFIKVVNPEYYEVTSSLSIRDLEEIKDGETVLEGASSTPKLYQQTINPKGNWVVKDSDNSPTDPEALAILAEHKAYTFLSEIASELSISLVPVHLVFNGKRLFGNAQPFIENAGDINQCLNGNMEDPAYLETIKKMMLQHWLDIYIDDFDDNYGNWLAGDHCLPIRIDHGYAFVDDIIPGNLKFKNLFRSSSVFKSLAKTHSNSPLFSSIAQSTLGDVASALNSKVTETLLLDTFKAMVSHPEYIIKKYLERARDFTEYAKKCTPEIQWDIPKVNTAKGRFQKVKVN